MTITSTAFENNEKIPPKYTCDGENVNPPLTFSEVPREAQSLVLMVDDPDAPKKEFAHWILYNLPSSTLQLLENEAPENGNQGKNDFGSVGYSGPCPPSGTHRYYFKLFALDSKLDIGTSATKVAVEQKMEGHVIEKAEIVGLYSKKT